MNAVGQVTQSREYISLSSLTYSTARNLGTSGVNYLETTMAYEPWGAQVVTVDPSGTVDEVFNDSLGRLTQEWVGTDDVPTTDFNGDSVIDSLDFRYWVSQNGSATTGPAGTSMKLRVKYCYDVDGKLTSLTDADQNTTTWEYDGYGRLIEETNELNASRLFSYDMLGNLLSKTDRDGRVTTYTYDDRNRLTEENWLDSQQNVIREIDYSYDGNSLLLSASDPDATYEYTYDGVGRLVSETQEIDGLTPTIVLASQYDDTGNRTQVAATVGGTADFVNDYTYDALGRTTSLSQHGTTGGNAVAEKLVDFTYNAAGRWNTITRYADLASTDLVATGTYGYDLAGRLTSLTYTKGIITLVDYDWTYNAASQLTQYINSIDGTVDYTNDATGQLTGADYDYQTDESYTYDENGNRTNTGYVTGDNNQLLSDGTYRYSYDPEGNRVAKFIDTDIDGVLDAGDTDVTIYAWDYRNRLTEVSHYDDYTAYSGEEPDQVVDYAYDYANRLVGKVLDADGDGTVDSSSAFVYDGNQIVLQFEKTGTDDISASSLSNRYFWGPAVDQLLAQESPLPLGEGLGEGYDLTTPGDVFWPLTDNLNTVRDLATYDSNTDTTTIANHRVYDAFGNLRSQTNAAVDCLFGYTGRQFDEDISLQNNLNRWYDASVGRWVSNDPIGYEGGINLFAYVNNSNCKRCQC
jgi:RHS repeat-associated protein